jgi:pilus assembly protein CpaE
VLGPTGGTGKTLTASNLSVALQEQGQRVALVDLDLQFGDIGLCMGLSPDKTIHDLVVAGGTLDTGKLEDFLTDHESGVKVLLAPSRPDYASAVTVESVREIYGVLQQRYDYVVIDTPPGFTPEVIASIDLSSDLVMVGMLDSLSLKNTKLGLETLDLMGYEHEKVQLVLNRAHSRVGISSSDVVAVLGREPEVLVPSDREIPRTVNEGVPIVQALPQSEAAQAFRGLASTFVARQEPAPGEEVGAGKGRKRFGRRG